MSIYFGDQFVGVSPLNGAKPVGLDEICNHTFISGDVVYNGERIYAGTFARTPITSFYGPNVKRFNNTADPTANGSGIYTFLGCTQLTSVTFPELLNPGTTGSSQFSGCTSLVLTSTSFPKLTTFANGGYTFYGCTSLVTIDSTIFPALTTFNGGGYHFSGCTNLVTVDLPNLTTFGGSGYQFQNCSKLKNVNLPKLTGNTSGGYQFTNCTALEHIFLPKASLQAGNCFRGCTSLKTAVFPHIGISATSMGQNDFYGCSNLEGVDIKTNKVNNQSFYNCTKMNVLILRNTSMATLNNVNAFTGSPFASGKAGGTIYVPSSLIATYQANTNWATILGYGSGAQNSIQAIEGSTYETKYFDGTSIT